MSISDRLDQISRQSVEADEQWDCGRSAFNADNHAPPIDVALANGDLMQAALRAVLDVCNETTIEARPHGDGESYMIVPVREVRAAIEAALGEGS